jgi:hypothetical protein
MQHLGKFAALEVSRRGHGIYGSPIVYKHILIRR